MKNYDAVMIGTGPSLEIDRKRTDDAVSHIEKVYGYLISYSGLWVVAGTLGGQNPETSQRARIKNHLLERDVLSKNIRIIEGEDTIDKTRHIIDLARSESLKEIGISDYFLHYERYVLALHYAKKEGVAPKSLEFSWINSPTPGLRRWTTDKMYGLASLAKEIIRLEKYGFQGSTPKNQVLKRISDTGKKISSGGQPKD